MSGKSVYGFWTGLHCEDKLGEGVKYNRTNKFLKIH